ncbi:hypothetical protein [Candidatus Methylacidithermus pantelleriae]|uniref:Uncharacterized protein n=1 Tax=Candidatus Methylacidithermus pantelleriae TaxID=2744239 RepID=A0A8J2BUG0_9BACT|nr:hypothetical protein [Candidatus Methylacidithermus pantelleriae]CAF0701188.1 hypothetical protein MPNT_40178 [Candidatus Methylacidithermus pantelleriae]
MAARKIGMTLEVIGLLPKWACLGKRDWQAERTSHFSVLGSKDMTAGNYSCQATVSTGASLLALWLRLPDGWGRPSQYLVWESVSFA